MFNSVAKCLGRNVFRNRERGNTNSSHSCSQPVCPTKVTTGGLINPSGFLSFLAVAYIFYCNGLLTPRIIHQPGRRLLTLTA